MMNVSVWLALCTEILFVSGCHGLLTEQTLLRANDAGAFRIRRPRQARALSSWVIPPWFTLLAKPPPTSNFDLSAIEAFENELDVAALEMESDILLSRDGVFDLDEDDALQSDVRFYIVPPELNNKRIDAALAVLDQSLSRSTCGELVTDGMVVLVDEKGGHDVVLDKKSFKVEGGMKLRVSLPVDEKPTEIEPEDIPLHILFEDEHMIVINKAAGMVVHPAAGNWCGTVVNALAHHLAKSPHGSGDFVGPNGRLQKSNDADGP